MDDESQINHISVIKTGDGNFGWDALDRVIALKELAEMQRLSREAPVRR